MQQLRQRQSSLELVMLEAQSGFRVHLLPLGAAIHRIELPLDSGSIDVALHYPDPADYENDPYYVGSTVGRYANRVAGGRFRIDGKEHVLDGAGEGSGHCLHGGNSGLHRQYFEPVQSGSDDALELRHVSPAGTGGFPGDLDISVRYQLIGASSLAIEYTATCTAATVVNLANHTYFNLDGAGTTIDEHVLQLRAERYTPVDSSMIPTGRIDPVHGTEYDFRAPRYLADATSGRPQRLDNNFVVGDTSGTLREVANLYSTGSGIRLVVHTTQPGLQVYTADELGPPFAPRQGICLEAQNFPDAPNHPGFPPAILRPGDVYSQRTIYEFILPAD